MNRSPDPITMLAGVAIFMCVVNVIMLQAATKRLDRYHERIDEIEARSNNNAKLLHMVTTSLFVTIDRAVKTGQYDGLESWELPDLYQTIMRLEPADRDKWAEHAEWTGPQSESD